MAQGIFLINFLQSKNIKGQKFYLTSDNLKLYVTDEINAELHEYDVSTKGDIITFVLLNTIDISSTDNLPRGIWVREDGLKLYLIGGENTSIYEFDFGTAGDITTLSLLTTESVASEFTDPHGLFLNSTGDVLIVVGRLDALIFNYALTVNWDIGSIIPAGSFSTTKEDSLPIDIDMSPDGSTMYILGDQFSNIYRYNQFSSFDVVSSTLKSASYIGSTDNQSTGLQIDNNTLKVYLVGTEHAKFYHYKIVDIQDFLVYYSNLLILQYKNLPKAEANIEADARLTIANNLILQLEQAFLVESAIGVQLTTLAKYVGANRFEYVFTEDVSQNPSYKLTDSELRTIMKLLILKNTEISSWVNIVDNIATFFPEMVVLDTTQMKLLFFLGPEFSTIAQIVVLQDYLPRPVTVGADVFLVPDPSKIFQLISHVDNPGYIPNPDEGFSILATSDIKDHIFLSWVNNVIVP